MKVLLLLGSSADEKYLGKCTEILKKMQVPYAVRVSSAHRSPDRVIALLKEFSDVKTIVCFAGHAAHSRHAIDEDAIAGQELVAVGQHGANPCFLASPLAREPLQIAQQLQLAPGGKLLGNFRFTTRSHAQPR